MTDKQERVYLVATGETVDGRETYTRHDSLPPMCDFETLFSAPPAQPAPAQEPQPVSNTDELPQRLSDERIGGEDD